MTGGGHDWASAPCERASGPLSLGLRGLRRVPAAKYGGWRWASVRKYGGSRWAPARERNRSSRGAPVGEGVGSRWTGRCSDRGSATVWAVGAVAVLCVVFGALLAMGQATVIRHRAAGAADLAALAAADHWAEGTDAACATAERVTRAQGARLVRCTIEGETSDVKAASGRGPFSAEVRSRAGPAGPIAVSKAPGS